MTVGLEEILALIEDRLYLFDHFLKNVETHFTGHPRLNGRPPIVHSVKSRIKNIDHIRAKIIRKQNRINPITINNVFDCITDISGVRVLHLYQVQFIEIHRAVQEKLDRNEWVLFEDPKAYTWDPESKEFFEKLGLQTKINVNFYTSVHYVVKPRPDVEASCEIQVRTLFEEIWGEIDHALNYPNQTTSLACQEQLKVLARLVSAGSRLSDSIFRTYNDELFKGKLEITEAIYESTQNSDNRIDVTNEIRASILNDRLDILVSNDIAEDPDYGYSKVLKIKYRISDSEYFDTFNEGQRAILPRTKEIER